MNTTANMTMEPVARGPLIDVHRRGGAMLAVENGWEIAVRYPTAPQSEANVLIDLSHFSTYEVNSPNTARVLKEQFGVTPQVRTFAKTQSPYVYRLSDRRAIIFCPTGKQTDNPDMIDVTGGWATIALIGPDAEAILNKITAVDLRATTLPVNGCCQGPLFGVNTLFGRFDNRFDLHICTDSAEFFWEVLMDAGREFNLTPAGSAFFSEVAP